MGINMQLYAPPSYVSATVEVRLAAVNGCGTGGWKGAIVPETLWFLDISEACNIHDWMYIAGSTIADKDEADRVFLNNMLRLIEGAGGPWLLQRLRRNRAWIYYEAVHKFGGPAFWAAKNPQTTMMGVAYEYLG